MPSVEVWQISACGRYLCTCSSRSRYKFHNVETDSSQIEGQLIGQTIVDVIFYVRGRGLPRKRSRESTSGEKSVHAVIASKNGHLLSIDLDTNTEVFRIPPPEEFGSEPNVVGLTVCEASDSFFLLTKERGIRKHSLKSGKFLQTVSFSKPSMGCHSVSDGGDLLAVAYDTSIAVLDMIGATPSRLYKCAGSLSPPTYLRFSKPDGLLLAGFDASQLIVWKSNRDLNIGKKRFPAAMLASHVRIVKSDFVVAHPEIIVGICKDGSVNIWHLGNINQAEDGVFGRAPTQPTLIIPDFAKGSDGGFRCKACVVTPTQDGTRLTLLAALVSKTAGISYQNQALKVTKDGQVRRRKSSSSASIGRASRPERETARDVPEVDESPQFIMKAKARVTAGDDATIGQIRVKQRRCAEALRHSQLNRSVTASKLRASQSIASVAEQGLQSSDPHIVEQLYKIGDAEVIRTTVRQISSGAATQLLTESINKLLENPARLREVREWIKQILIHHSGHLLLTPDRCEEALEQLYQHLTERMDQEDLLSKLVGRVEGVLYQSTVAATQKQAYAKFCSAAWTPLVQHVEGQTHSLSEPPEARGDEDQFADDDLHDEDD